MKRTRYIILKEWTDEDFSMEVWIARNRALKPHVILEQIEFPTEDNILEDLIQQAKEERHA